MNNEEKRRFLAQFDKAREEMDQLSKMFPAWFDRDGRPIVAELRLPLSTTAGRRPTIQEILS